MEYCPSGLHENQRHGDDEANQGLQQQFAAPVQSQVLLAHHLQIVVGKADCAEGQRGTHHQPDEGVRQIRPEQRGQHDGDHDQQSSHGRRAGFLLMRARSLLADILADLEFAQAADHRRADDERHEQRRQAGKGRAEREVAEDPERPHVEVPEYVLV